MLDLRLRRLLLLQAPPLPVSRSREEIARVDEPVVPDDREVEDRAGLVDVPVVGDPVVLEVEVPVVPVVEVQAVRDEAVDSTAEVREEDSIHPRKL